MGLLWRLLAPRPAKRMRRAAYRAANPLSYVTPRPVKQVRRAAFNATHPWELVERGVENAIVDSARGSTRRRSAPQLGQPLAPALEDGYDGIFEITASALDRIAEHARAAQPALCCGLVGDSDDGVSVHPGHNSSPTSRESWRMSGEEFARLEQQIADRGGEPIAVYHSMSPAFGRNLEYLSERSTLNVPYLLCFLAEPSQFRVFDPVRGGLAELKIELIEEVEGYPQLDLFLEVKDNGGQLLTESDDLIKRFKGTYEDLADLDALLEEAGFCLDKRLAELNGDRAVRVGVDQPPVSFEVRYRLEHGTRKSANVAIARLLEDLGRKRLTEAARDEILDLLDDVGLACDEEALSAARLDDKLKLWLAPADHADPAD